MVKAVPLPLILVCPDVTGMLRLCHAVLSNHSQRFVTAVIIEIAGKDYVGIRRGKVNRVNAFAYPSRNGKAIMFRLFLSSATAWGMDHEDMKRVLCPENALRVENVTCGMVSLGRRDVERLLR